MAGLAASSRDAVRPLAVDYGGASKAAPQGEPTLSSSKGLLPLVLSASERKLFLKTIALAALLEDAANKPAQGPAGAAKGPLSAIRPVEQSAWARAQQRYRQAILLVAFLKVLAAVGAIDRSSTASSLRDEERLLDAIAVLSHLSFAQQTQMVTNGGPNCVAIIGAKVALRRKAKCLGGWRRIARSALNRQSLTAASRQKEAPQVVRDLHQISTALRLRKLDKQYQEQRTKEAAAVSTAADARNASQPNHQGGSRDRDGSHYYPRYGGEAHRAGEREPLSRWGALREHLPAADATRRLVERGGEEGVREKAGNYGGDGVLQKDDAAALKKWHLACRFRRYVARRNGPAQVAQRRTAFGAWLKAARLGRRYKNYIGAGSFFIFAGPTDAISCVEADLTTIGAAAGPASVATFVLREWRAACRLHYRQIGSYGALGTAKAFSAWRQQARRWSTGAPSAAAAYDAMRCRRPVLYAWLAALAKMQVRGDRASHHYRSTKKVAVLDAWHQKRRNNARINKFFGRWRSAGDFTSKCWQQAAEFASKKVIVRALQHLRMRLNINVALTKASDRLQRRQGGRLCHGALAVWRQLRSWIDRNSEKVRTIRCAKDASACMYLWRRWRRTIEATRAMRRASLKRSHLDTWRAARAARALARATAGSVMEGWRRLLLMRRALYQFHRERHPALQGRGGGKSQSDSKAKGHDIELSCRTYLMVRTLHHWRRLASLSRTLEMFGVRRDGAAKASLFKGWRLDANVNFYLQQAPWRRKRRTLCRMRDALRASRERHKANGGDLAAYEERRRYICTFRGFERWQQTFQAHKMEEHLCQQNLAYYENQRRFQIIRGWKLVTGLHMLQRVQSYNGRRKTLPLWRAHAAASEKGRASRTLGRLVAFWRRARLTRRAKDMAATAGGQRTGSALAHWRAKAAASRQRRHQSMEALGSSTVRYYLQKWRMETTIHKYSGAGRRGDRRHVQEERTAGREQGRSVHFALPPPSLYDRSQAAASAAMETPRSQQAGVRHVLGGDARGGQLGGDARQRGGAAPGYSAEFLV